MRTISFLLLTACFVNYCSGQVVYDPTLVSTLCSFGGPNTDARGARNLIPNGHFNTGSTCGNISNIQYSGRSSTSWSDTYSSSQTRYPYGIPSIKNFNLPWYYAMYWRNECSVPQVTNIQKGYMYADLYRKFSNGTENRNYILIELNKSLEEGKEYTFEANYNTFNSTSINIAPDNVNLQMDRIGFVLTDSIPNYTPGQPIVLPTFFETEKDTIVDLDHHAVNMTITGHGERYLIIGNFHENDSITFNATPALNSHATYAFDNLKLYDPLCDNYGNVYLLNDIENCPANSNAIYAQYGISPWSWYINDVLQPDTLNHINVLTGYDTLNIKVQSGQGNCISQDSIKITPKYIAIDLLEDTMRFCDFDVHLTPTATVVGSTFLNNYKWRKVSDPNNILSTTLNYTALDTGLYFIDATHQFSCHEYDTVFIDVNTEILWNELSYNVGDEHCINMGDGFISYDTTNYPGEINFYWNSNLISSNEIIYDSLTAGTYSYYVFDDSNRCSLVENTINLSYDSCSIISGIIYNDTNYNCTLDTGEEGLSNITIYTDPLNNLSVTDSTGYYEILVPPGVYSLHQNLMNDVSIGEFCSNGLISASTSGLIFSSNLIGDTIRQYYHDPTLASMTMEPISMISPYTYLNFDVANGGDSIDNITVKLHIDHPILTYDLQCNEFQGMNGDTAIYVFPDMSAFSQISCFNIFQVSPNTNYIGDTVTIHMLCYGNYNDINILNNEIIQKRIVTAAYDPNVKFVSPMGEDQNHRTMLEEREFTYTIHFQNTGNAPAQNVVIKDTISNNLDLSTFHLMGQSHPVEVFVYNNVLEFKFDEIYLPDSTTNEPESKGFVQFKIHSTQQAYIGDSIVNTANIYFDNNPPIITEETINIYYKPTIFLDTNAVACYGNTINFHSQIYDSTSIYSDTISTYFADTIISANITIRALDHIDVNASICRGEVYNFHGEDLTDQGVYVDTLVNYYGCDSIVQLVLDVTSIDTTVTIVSAIELMAEASGYSYQWYDCLNEENIIGETNQNLFPTENGLYAVIFDNGTCTDTSNCYSMNSLTVKDQNQLRFKINPNPTNGTIHISSELEKISKIELYNSKGILISTKNTFPTEKTFIDIEGAAGIYLLFITNSNDETGVFRVIKTN